jgi:hypothetical protein
VSSQPSAFLGNYPTFMVAPLPAHEQFAESHRLLQTATQGGNAAGGQLVAAADTAQNTAFPRVALRHDSASYEFVVHPRVPAHRPMLPSAVSSMHSASNATEARSTWEPHAPTPLILSATRNLQSAAAIPNAGHARPQPVSVRLACFGDSGKPTPAHLHRFPKASSVAIAPRSQASLGVQAVVYLGQNSVGASVVHL